MSGLENFGAVSLYDELQHYFWCLVCKGEQCELGSSLANTVEELYKF